MRRVAVTVFAALLAGSLLAAPPAEADFGFVHGAAGFNVAVAEAGGGPATLAGSHPFALSAELAFERDPSGYPEGDLRDLFLALPPGLIENPTAVPRCSEEDFNTPRSSPYETSRSGESCPAATQIGVASVETAAGARSFGIFNLAPPPGHPSRFGFAPYGAPISFTPEVRQAGGEYGITLASEGFPQLFDTRMLELTIWGVPWAPAHDGERGNCLDETDPALPHAQCPVSSTEQGHTAWAYLTLPSSCAAPLTFAAAADRWGQPGRRLSGGGPDLADPAWKRAEFAVAGLEGCEQLPFSSQATVQPSTDFVSSPSGLALRLETSQGGLALLSPASRFSAQIRRLVVALPEGMTLNPSVGAGLGACSAAQYAAESATSTPGAGCPNPSKIGVVTLETPLVGEVLKGSLFIAEPFANPFASPYALYFVARSAERGFVVKVAGKLDADARTGRLTATFDDLPQLPYSNLKVDFRAGQRAPLVSPAACGSYLSQVTLSSWGDTAPVRQSSKFTLTKGIVPGGACPRGGAPFSPAVTAGTLNANAGSRTPFYLHLARGDAEQEITSYSAQLPPGLLGTIAGVPFCPDAAIEAAKGRSGSAETLAPSCSAASQIGHTVSGYGVGLAPAYAPGKLYLAGPYRGAPLSIVAIDPAVVGPFDLGTVVIRSAIQIDPRSARVTVDSSASDPIPHIFAGIPLRLRDVRVHIDRPGFMLNPTSCAPFSIATTLTGSDAPFADPRAAAAGSTTPFQLSNCASLGFSPRIALALAGGTRRGDYPRLRVTVTPRPGDANIAAAAVTLPPSLFLAQNHIRTICTRLQAATDACPSQAIVGSVRAESPLLGEPMEGPVYLRSSANPLPDLVAVLRGRGIRIVLEGRVDSRRGGLRGSFEGLPDAPVSRFTMTLFGGARRGILVVAERLCRSAQVAAARFAGHNDLGAALRPKLALPCGMRKASRARPGQTRRSGGRAEVVQRGHLRVAFEAELSPRALPRLGAAPVSVSLGGRIATTDGATPPQLRRISIAVNRYGRLDPASLPVCRVEQIQPATTEGALEACGRSLVGHGSFSAKVLLPDQAPFPSRGRAYAYNGTFHGRPAILVHVYGTQPAPTSYTLPFQIAHTAGTYGTVLTASLPDVTSEWGYVTGLGLTLDRTVSPGGRDRVYLSASCPAPEGFPGAVFPLARTSFEFAGGVRLSAAMSRNCKVDGRGNK